MTSNYSWLTSEVIHHSQNLSDKNDRPVFFRENLLIFNFIFWYGIDPLIGFDLLYKLNNCKWPLWRIFLKVNSKMLNFGFWQKSPLLTKISIFGQNFPFLTEVSTFDKKFDFWPNFPFLTEISIVDQIFFIFDRNLDFWPKFRFVTKILIFDQKSILARISNLFTKISILVVIHQMNIKNAPLFWSQFFKFINSILDV